MIERARDRWYASPECTVADLITYMTQHGYMRDAQIEAIKTYLYLKVACNCQSLKKLFCQGTFNTLNLDDLEISKSTREFLKGKKAAAALVEYALLPMKQVIRYLQSWRNRSRKPLKVLTMIRFSRMLSMVYPTRIICSAFLWVQAKLI